MRISDCKMRYCKCGFEDKGEKASIHFKENVRDEDNHKELKIKIYPFDCPNCGTIIKVKDEIKSIWVINQLYNGYECSNCSDYIALFNKIIDVTEEI